jgi:hypothetical protein
MNSLSEVESVNEVTKQMPIFHQKNSHLIQKLIERNRNLPQMQQIDKLY